MGKITSVEVLKYFYVTIFLNICSVSQTCNSLIRSQILKSARRAAVLCTAQCSTCSSAAALPHTVKPQEWRVEFYSVLFLWNGGVCESNGTVFVAINDNMECFLHGKFHACRMNFCNQVMAFSDNFAPSINIAGLQNYSALIKFAQKSVK